MEEKDEIKQKIFKIKQSYYIDFTSNNDSTKLLVPRNGTNVEETVNIENKLNLVYNIFM